MGYIECRPGRVNLGLFEKFIELSIWFNTISLNKPYWKSTKKHWNNIILVSL